MLTTFCKALDVITIIQSLPAEQVEHMIHVGAFVGIMAKKILGLEDFENEAYKDFGKAAFYHDIGKAWVPYEILSKSDKLTAEEIHITQKHPVFARELFALINRGAVSGMPLHLFQMAHDSAVYHHEWWNGKGYPYGISCEHIPLIARITAICDAYDAIISDRAYRKANTHYYACHELEINAGTQFDPTLVKLFLDNEAEFSALVKNEYRSSKSQYFF